MPFLSDDLLTRSLLAIDAAKGSVFYDRLRPQPIGVGTSRTSLSTTYAIPQRAKQVVAIQPRWTPSAVIAAIAYAAIFDIAGTSFTYQPQQVFGPQAGGNLGALAAPLMSPGEWWRIYGNVAAGDTYDWGVTPQVAIAANGRGAVDIMYATVPAAEPTLYGVAAAVQTLTAATTGDITGGSITLTSAIDLAEVAGYALASGVLVAGDKLNADLTFQSDGLFPVQQFRLGIEPTPPGVGVSFEHLPNRLSREVVFGMSFQVQNPIVKLTLNVDTAITNGGVFSGIGRYRKSTKAGS